MKLGIFLPNWLGDLVMATPALRAIRRHFGPQAHIVGIMRPKLAGLLAGTELARRAVVLRSAGEPSGSGGAGH